MLNNRKSVLVHQIFCVASVEYKRWITSTKMLLLLLITVYMKQQLIEPLLELTDNTGGCLQVFEPGIAFMGSSNMMFFLPLIYLLVMGDFPRQDSSTIFVMNRVGKKGWFWGQLLFGIMAAGTVLTGMILVITLWCVGRLNWNNGNWSDAVTKYYQEVGSDFKFNLITGRISNQTNPVPAFFHSFCLVFLMLFMLSVLLLLFTVCGKKMLGFGICGFCAVVGNSLAIFETRPLMWFFPMAHTQIRLRHELLFDGESVSLYGSYIYFLASILLGIILSGLVLKRRKRFV